MEMSEVDRVQLSNLLQSLCEKIGVKDTSNDLERDVERHLQAVNDSFKRILKADKNDVFVSHLMDELESLASICIDASTKGVMRVTEHQFQSAQLLLNAFGDSEKVFRYTWKISAGQRLFEDETWRKHFELTSSLAMSGAIEVRTLVILEDRHACEAVNIQKLLEFFATQENLGAKIVLNADWNACAVDHGISPTCIEFGLYGANLLYEANAYSPISVGSWSRNAVEVGRYTRFFDAIWSAHSVAAENPASQQRVRMSQVIAADATVERRQGTMRNVVHDKLAQIEERMKLDVA